ncbi:DNA replication/repair protein RecF [Dinoroseobacter sp. PD6]|uniref:DNA replication/repair protein RecF n=1 Tax=Dinoroseobacter sp. PD6 TaxID=3028384 RepID=UPI00237BEAC7|nr:DNA replication/repair protein RecF [Dinoroseobacter sp. PD6]MDD9718171.1 DNA replication/repair protein RecF [Dinoroseobacter sp. PD6]
MTGVAVTSLSLSHFRSHTHLTLSLDERPVVLHGPNGIGKTNVLEALSFLSPGRGLRRAKTEAVGQSEAGLGWRVSALVKSGGREREVMTRSDAGASRTVQLDGKPVPQMALAELVPMVWLVPAMDRLWIEAAEGRRKFLDRMTLNFVTTHGRDVLAYERAMRDRNRLLKDGVRDPHWYHALEAQMAEAGARITQNRQRCLSEIEAAQADATTAFPFAGLQIEAHDGRAPLRTEGEIENTLRCNRYMDQTAGRTLDGPHRDDLAAVYVSKGTPARDCSTGEQKALLISLILSMSRAVKSLVGQAPLVLLDEVAAHLDQERQRALYDEICALGAQAWMTGTGAELFQPLGERAQFIALPLDGT